MSRSKHSDGKWEEMNRRHTERSLKRVKEWSEYTKADAARAIKARKKKND